MDAPFENLGHYRILRALGEGGMGVVYEAEDLRLGRRVALKVLSVHHQSDVVANRRFLDEARAVAALEHPHICTLYEWGEDDGRAFIAMQLVEGETLRGALASGPLDEARAGTIVAAIAAALQAAHAAGILHRDVKTENVLLGRQGEIKLSDFGLARITGAERLTSSATMLGTPAYVAPETLRGDPPAAAADQFALAVVAYECVTGTPPFSGNEAAALMYAILNEFPDPPTRRRPGLRPAWNDVLLRALDKDPARRFASVGAFGSAIAAIPALANAVVGVPEAISTPGVRSLAVLFFENVSGEAEHDYFCDGITEDLLTDLAKVPGIKVASRNAVVRYRGAGADLRRIASELGVEAVVEGRLRKLGDRVRITVQLVDPRTDFQLWGERYDRTLEDVFDLQEEITNGIASALGHAPEVATREAMRRAKPRDVGAYDLYLKGRELYRRYTREDVGRALECFEQAVEIEPAYALAWAGIADSCAQMVDKGWDLDPRWRTRGMEAARRAIELDPGRPEGYKAEALMWQIGRESTRAISALERALEIDPSFIPALINLAQEQLTRGDFAGAERALHRAAAVDPAYGLSHLMLALVYLYTRRWRDAVSASHRGQNAGASPFHSSYAYAMRAQAYVGLGDAAAAREEVAGGRAAGLSSKLMSAAEALIDAHAGAADQARERVAALDADPPAESYGCELAAAAAGTLGDAARVVRFLRAAEAIDQRHPPSWWIHPDFAAVRDTAEFLAHLDGRGRTLVWPIEAPALSEAERRPFDHVGEASGLTERIVLPAR